MLTYVCDYSATTPSVVANFLSSSFNRNHFPISVTWVDVDEDRFELNIIPYFKENSFSTADKELLDSLVAPILFEE